MSNLTGTFRVVNATPAAKGVKLMLALVGSDKDPIRAAAYKDSGFTLDDFTVGDEKPAVLVWHVKKESSDGGFYTLESWGEKEVQKPQGRWQPKTPDELAVDLTKSVLSSTVHIVGQMMMPGGFSDKSGLDRDAVKTFTGELADVLAKAAVRSLQTAKEGIQ